MRKIYKFVNKAGSYFICFAFVNWKYWALAENER